MSVGLFCLHFQVSFRETQVFLSTDYSQTLFKVTAVNREPVLHVLVVALHELQWPPWPVSTTAGGSAGDTERLRPRIIQRLACALWRLLLSAGTFSLNTCAWPEHLLSMRASVRSCFSMSLRDSSCQVEMASGFMSQLWKPCVTLLLHS